MSAKEKDSYEPVKSALERAFASIGKTYTFELHERLLNMAEKQ